MESHQIAFRNGSSHKNLFLFFGVVVVSSLFYSRYVLSIGMFGWMALSFFEQTENNAWKFRWWYRLTGETAAEKALGVFPFFFILVALSLAWSDWSAFGLSRIRLALPFIGLPLAFLHLPRINRKDIDFLMAVLVLSALVSMGYVLFQLFFFPQDYHIDRGKSISTPVNHVRYGLLIAISSLMAFNLFLSKSVSNTSFLKKVFFLVSSVGLALFTFYLSVRTGWMALAAGGGILFFELGWRKRNGKMVAAVLMVLFSMGFTAYVFFPPVQQKIHYTINDWQQFEEGRGWTYSDATRWRSLVVGGEVFLSHPYLGAGVGDIRKEVNAAFSKRYPASGKKILPHNQYMYWLAAFGSIGFLLCLAIVLQPLGFSLARREIGHLQTQIIFLLSFLTEATWQSSLGIGVYLVFTLLFLSLLWTEESSEDHAEK